MKLIFRVILPASLALCCGSCRSAAPAGTAEEAVELSGKDGRSVSARWEEKPDRTPVFHIVVREPKVPPTAAAPSPLSEFKPVD